MDVSVKQQITTDDLIRSGACYDGVMKWHAANASGLTALDTSKALEIAKKVGGTEYITKAVSGYGYGDGNGYGYSDGYGYGYSDGYGYGYGYGDGNGYGYGDGDGGYSE